MSAPFAKLATAWIALYPLIAHLGLWTAHPEWSAAWLTGLVLLLLLRPPHHRQAAYLFTAIVAVATVGWLIYQQQEIFVLYLPPVVIPATLGVMFGRSLAIGQTPLITRFATLIEGGELDDGHKRYTRRVTQLWTALFAVMVIMAIGLAIWAPVTLWSWVTHIGNYILIAVVLITEFIYRRLRFKSANNSFKHFVKALATHKWHSS